MLRQLYVIDQRSLSEIGREIGIHMSTVRNLLEHAGIPVRSRSDLGFALPEVPVPAPEPEATDSCRCARFMAETRTPPVRTMGAGTGWLKTAKPKSEQVRITWSRPGAKDRMHGDRNPMRQPAVAAKFRGDANPSKRPEVNQKKNETRLRNGHWFNNGGRTRDPDGYILVRRPNHPGANAAGYVREHRLVMESVVGRFLYPWEVVHHRNGKKDDNRPENLELCVDEVEHRRIHRGEVGGEVQG